MEQQRMKFEQEKEQAEEQEKDESLIGRARGGDAAAFDELVRRHRMKAFTWAARISKDPHLSEDIVQEALIRAFLNLGTLAHDHRFLGWLRGIVKNQALMKLRRGGPYAREMPVSAYQIPVSRQNQVNPYDLDSIMDYLLTRADGTEPAGASQDPQLLLERKEWYAMVKGLLRCLTVRERRVFEAHFFEACSPQEIAELFRISTGNVYKMISRSRKKMQEERLSFLIRAHIRQRKDDGFMNSKTIDKRPLQLPGGSMLTGTETLYRFAGARHPDYSLSYVEGFLTSAFLLNIEKTRVDMSSTNMIDRNYLIVNGMLNLGLDVRYAEAFDFDPPDPRLMTEAIALAQRSIDRGMPAMVWELLHAEFGLIYGYDDEKQQFLALDTQSDERVPYDRLGRLQTRSLFVLGYHGDVGISQADALWRTCRMISRHARGGDLTFTGYANGLAAYDAWIGAFRQKNVEPLGHAYTIAVVLETRGHAVKFLAELGLRWEEDDSPAGPDIRTLLQEASEHYSRAAEELRTLERMFPAPAGGEPDEPETAEAAVSLLQAIRAAEEAGVGALERIADRLEQAAPRGHVPPIVENPPRAYVM